MKIVKASREFQTVQIIFDNEVEYDRWMLYHNEGKIIQ